MYELLIGFFLESEIKKMPKAKSLIKKFPDVTDEQILEAWPAYLVIKNKTDAEKAQSNAAVDGSESVEFVKPFDYAHGGLLVKRYSGLVENCPLEVVESAKAIGGFFEDEKPNKV